MYRGLKKLPQKYGKIRRSLSGGCWGKRLSQNFGGNNKGYEWQRRVTSGQTSST